MKTEHPCPSAAFTLLEMAIVLAILALVTHLAVVRLDRDSRTLRAQRQLESLRLAIAGPDNEVDAEGRPVRSGFLADMGRLPRAVRETDGRLTLAELWQCPDTAPGGYRVRATVAGNLVRPDGSPADAADEDPNIHIAGGWRGPYVRLSVGRTRLLDPWGNELANGDDPALAHLLGEGTLPAGEGGSIAFVRTFGSDGAPNWDGATESARDLVLTNESATASLTVIPYFSVHGTNETGSAVVSQDMDPKPTILRVYGPFGDQIAVARCEPQPLASGGTLTVEGLTPGPRVFRIERDGVRHAIHPVLLRPGANAVTVNE